MRVQYKAIQLLALLLLLIALFFLPSNAEDAVRVKRVLDSDTLLLRDGEYVRLIGVDTPETKHPEKPVEYFGKEAYLFTRKMVEGKKVRLEYDWKRRDKYDRILGYVYLMDGTFLNAEIIKQGYGFAILNTLSSIWRSLENMRGRRGRIREGYGDKN